MVDLKFVCTIYFCQRSDFPSVSAPTWRSFEQFFYRRKSVAGEIRKRVGGSDGPGSL